MNIVSFSNASIDLGGPADSYLSATGYKILYSTGYSVNNESKGWRYLPEWL